MDANSSSIYNLLTTTPKDLTVDNITYQLLDNDFQSFLVLKDSIEFPALVVCCIVGVLGSLLTLVTMSFNEAFSEPVFICYRAIAIYEIVVAVGFGYNAFYKLWPKMRIYKAWLWAEEIAVRFMLDPFRESVSVLTIFLSFGRIVAAFLPLHHRQLDHPIVSYVIIVLSLVLFVAVDLPHIAATEVKWSESAKTYAMSQTGPVVDFCNELKNALWITLSVGLLVSTVLAIAAFLKGVSLRRRLFKEGVGNGTGILFENDRNFGSPLDAVKKNLQLCYLQLCLNVPLIFYNALFFVLKWWKDAEIAAEKKKGNFSWAYQQAWLLLFLYTAEAIAHFFHFYLYVVFSETFRVGFLNRFAEKVKTWPKRS